MTLIRQKINTKKDCFLEYKIIDFDIILRDSPHMFNNKKESRNMTNRSWWSLKIEDYPNYKPSDIDLEHIAEQIKQGYDNGELIQENEEEETN